MNKTGDVTQDANFPPQYYPPYIYRGADDEISLLDLGKVLYRRGRVFLATLLACLILASVYILLKPSLYEFRSVIEVGVYSDSDGGVESIESFSSVLSRVNSSSIPAAIQRVSQEMQVPVSSLPGVTASITENSRMLVLTSSITNDAEHQTQASAVHQAVIDSLIASHLELIDTRLQELDILKRSLDLDLNEMKSRSLLETKLADLNVAKSRVLTDLERLSNNELRQIEVQRLQRNLSSAQRELQSMLEQETNLRERIGRQSEKEQLLLKQLTRAEADLDALRSSRQNVIDVGLTGSTQLSQSLLMIDSQINTALNSVRSLENSLYLGLPDENAEYRRSLVNLVSDIGIQESLVDEAQKALREFEISRDLSIQQVQAEADRLETEINLLEQSHESGLQRYQFQIASVDNKVHQISNSRAVIEPSVGQKAHSQSPGLILFLGGLLGLMLGTVTAFFAEFIARLRQSMHDEQSAIN
ncbi:hypothetical protein [Nitrincola sp.]|uniref:hypothetical protein n=1 Tax=Nitrincola sp. TaxID=1926584 RepID=UPI003A8FAC08